MVNDTPKTVTLLLVWKARGGEFDLYVGPEPKGHIGLSLIPGVWLRFSYFKEDSGRTKHPNKEAAMAAMEAEVMAEGVKSKWQETVMTIFDDLHFKPGNVFEGGPTYPLSRRILDLIEERHSEWFCGPSPGSTQTRTHPMASDQTPKTVTILLTAEKRAAMIKAMAESQAVDDEGRFDRLIDILGFSGENAARTVLDAALDAALAMEVENNDAADAARFRWLVHRYYSAKENEDKAHIRVNTTQAPTGGLPALIDADMASSAETDRAAGEGE